MIVESLDDAGQGVRVVFAREGDRWRHCVEFVKGECAENAWASVEGTPEMLWPASPAIQECHLQEGPHGPCLLAVGQAGKSHWSLSVSRSPNRTAVAFDIACRVRQSPEFLGSTYLAASETLASASVRLVTDSPHSCETLKQFVTPSPIIITKLPTTFRWQYRWELAAE